MHSILSGLAPLALLVLIVSLIKPGLMLAWMPSEKRTRGKAALVYGAVFLALAIATGASKPMAVAPAMSSPSPIEAGPQDEGAMFQAWCEESDRHTNIIREADAIFGYAPQAGIPIGEAVLVKEDTWSESVKIPAGTRIKVLERRMIDKMNCVYKVRRIEQKDEVEVESSVLGWYETPETTEAWMARRTPWVEAELGKMRNEFLARGFPHEEMLRASIKGDWVQRYKAGDCQ